MSTIKWKSLVYLAATKLFNVAKDLWSCGVGNEKEKTDEKTRLSEYHRLDPNLAATYQLCP